MSEGERPSTSVRQTRSTNSKWMPGTRLLTLGALVIIAVLGLAAVIVYAGFGSVSPRTTSQSGTMKLHAPTGLFVSGLSNGSVLISWQPPHPAPIGYRIYRSIGRNGPYTFLGSVNAPNIDTFTDDTDHTAGMTYVYTVTAYSRQGESAPTGPIEAVVLASPSTPTIPVPRPLPTFAAIAATTLTSTLGAPQRAANVIPVPRQTSVAELPSAMPTPTARTALPTPTMRSFGAIPATSMTPTKP